MPVVGLRSSPERRRVGVVQPSTRNSAANRPESRRWILVSMGDLAAESHPPSWEELHGSFEAGERAGSPHSPTVPGAVIGRGLNPTPTCVEGGLGPSPTPPPGRSRPPGGTQGSSAAPRIDRAACGPSVGAMPPHPQRGAPEPLPRVRHRLSRDGRKRPLAGQNGRPWPGRRVGCASACWHRGRVALRGVVQPALVPGGGGAANLKQQVQDRRIRTVQLPHAGPHRRP